MENTVGVILVTLTILVCIIGYFAEKRAHQRAVKNKYNDLVRQYEKTKHITETVTATIQLMDGNSLSFMETFATTLEKSSFLEGCDYVASAVDKASIFRNRLNRSYINGITHEGVFYTPAAIASVKID